MKMIKNKRTSRLLTPLFCSIGVLVASQAFAGTPSVTLNADKDRGNIAESGRLGYVGGSTTVGISIDKNLQGQVDVNQVVSEDDISATSVEGWFGYQLKDKNGASKGVKGAGVKLNHLWVERGGKYQSDTVHKAFGAYDKNADDHAKVTAGYGQEQRDLFWSGHVSKGISDKNIISINSSHQTSEKAYDYGVGGEVGTFLEDSLTRIRGGVDYEWGTEHANTEDKPTQATISAGVQQYFYDSPHSLTLDVSASKKSGGSTTNTTNSNARVGYQYEFGKAGTFQSNRQQKRTRVEIPGVPAIAAIPAISGKPAKYSKKTIKTPYTKLVKTTMKLENETFFKLNSSQLTASAKKNINKIATEIRRNSYTGAIRITGNTCGLGDAKYDQRLSERRAKAVKKYLIKAGLNPAHLVARGLGKNHPKYRNDPASGFKNRRVDIEYVSQRSVKKKAYKTSYKNVLVSAGTQGRPGKAGISATPARFIWKTEEIKSAPLWVKRALHNPIRHKRSVDTYQTQTSLLKAVDDTYTLTSREELLDVLENDATGLTDLTILTGPAHGTVEIIDGKIKYTANAEFAGGADQFTYQVKDADGNIYTAIVTLTVPVPTSKNIAPTAVDDVFQATPNTAKTYNVVTNDSDADGDTLTISNISTQPSKGTVTFDGQEITYTANNGETGKDTFTYIITDGNGHTATATVTVTISDTSATPILSPNYAATYGETSVTIPVLDDDTAPSGSTLELTGNYSDPEHGDVIVDTSNGTVTYRPEAGYTGIYSFTYEATDNNGFTDSAVVTVNVKTADNRGASDDFIEIDINDSPQPEHDLVANDSAGLKICSGSISGNSGDSSVNISADKTSVSYTANSYAGATDSFDYDVCDTDGNKVDTATVHIALGGFGGAENQAPTAGVVNTSVDGGNSVTIDVLGNNNSYDADGDTLTLVGISTSGSHGSAIISNGKIVYTADTDNSDDDTVIYVFTDSHGHYVEGTIKINITSIANSAPTIDSIPAINITAGDYSTADIDLALYFHDSNLGDSVYLANAYAASGDLEFDATKIWYTPKSAEAVSGTTDTIYIAVSDGKDEVASTIVVNFN